MSMDDIGPRYQKRLHNFLQQIEAIGRDDASGRLAHLMETVPFKDLEVAVMMAAEEMGAC